MQEDSISQVGTANLGVLKQTVATGVPPNIAGSASCKNDCRWHELQAMLTESVPCPEQMQQAH